MQNELKPFPCGNTVEVKYIAGIGKTIIEYSESDIGYMIRKCTTVDAVEVVRCKDCLYSTERYGHMECIHGVSYRNTWNKPDFFCAYGERKEGADNG